MFFISDDTTLLSSCSSSVVSAVRWWSALSDHRHLLAASDALSLLQLLRTVQQIFSVQLSSFAARHLCDGDVSACLRDTACLSSLSNIESRSTMHLAMDCSDTSSRISLFGLVKTIRRKETATLIVRIEFRPFLSFSSVVFLFRWLKVFNQQVSSGG